MEDFILFVLCVAVVWLAVKLSLLSSRVPDAAELRQTITTLERRIMALERTPQPAATTPPEPAPPAPAPLPTQVLAASHPAPPAIRPHIAPPSPPAPPARQPLLVPPPPPLAPIPPRIPQPSAEPKRSISIEERLGQNWLSKIGIVSVVIGVALFLGRELLLFGPLGKSLTGLALAAVILLGSVWLERKPAYRLFARAGIGGGWALTFFLTFALYHVDAMKIVDSQALDLVLMFLVAAAMVAHSLRYKSQVVTSLAFLLAFLTVGISHVTLFSLVAGAMLAAGVVVIAYRERWFSLALAGLAGAYFNHFLWLLRVLPDGGQPGHPFADFYPSAGLLLLYWLLFRLLFVLRVPADQRQQTISSITAIVNSAGLLFLLKYQSAHPEWAFRALLALGVAEWIFAFIGRTRWRPSFIVLSTIASGLLLAAVPFRFSGAHWTLLWLAEAEILFLVGVRMPELVFRRLGMLAAFLTSVQLIGFGVLPIIQQRSTGPSTGTHLSLEIALFAAAILLWFNAEVITRRAKPLFAAQFDAATMLVSSYLAPTMLALGLWVAMPSASTGAWAAVAWLAASLAIAYSARALQSVDLASQADLLALAAILRLALINFNLAPGEHRTFTIALSAALLYAGMWRRTRSHILPLGTVPAAYSWAASSLLALLAWYEFQPLHLAIAWGIFGLILFEVGTLFRRSCLRHQAYALFLASCVRIFLVDLNTQLVFDNTRHHPHLVTIIPLVAAYLWVYERTRRALADSTLDLTMGMAAAWIGTFTTTALLIYQLAPERVAIAWSALALLLLYAAWLLGRPLFTAQALTILAAATADVVLVHLLAGTVPDATFWSSRWYFVGAACLLMFLALPAAFAIRRRRLALPDAASLDLALTHPEQPFFFIPLLLLAALVVVQLTGDRITIGWIALGLAAFLAALPIGERSYRLAGLALLLLGVAKVYVIDIWNATAIDRYLTLIVTGAALLLVSFLYSRYRETILKFL